MSRKFEVDTEACIGALLLAYSSSQRIVPARILRAWLAGRTLDITLNPSGYSDAKDFAIDYQVSRLLKKFPGGSPKTRRANALAKFREAEEICGKTNVRFCNLTRTASPLVWTQLQAAKNYVHRVLGEFDWDQALPHCDFGPGASIGVKRRNAHLVNKIGKSNPTVTWDCLALAKAYKAWHPRIGVHLNEYNVVRGSKITTVPKDAKTDRVIAIEPLWNMFFQKGIGGVIRRRLRRVGLDLNEQADKNAEFACEGSRYGCFATLDLSMASDTVALELVRYLLPESWFAAMTLTRSRYCEVDGGEVLLKKFSSMGNGFTFELESLIFLALVWASTPVGSRTVNVDIATFGDDIICRPESAKASVDLLNFCGFTTNIEKSFITGPFRESCGKHYFDGFDVTPFHLDKRLVTLHDVLWAANSIARWAARMGGNIYRDSLVKEAYDFVVEHLPQRVRRLGIPDGYGDDGLIAPWDIARPSLVKRPGCGQVWWAYKVLQVNKRISKHNGESAISAWLFKSDHFAPMERDLLPRVTEFEVGKTISVRKRTLEGQWPWLGPWV